MSEKSMISQPPKAEATRLWETGKPERGFVVSMLPERPHPVAVGDAFTGDQERVNELYQRYYSGDHVRIVHSPFEVAPGEEVLTVATTVMVAENKFREAMASQKNALKLIEELGGEDSLDMAFIDADQVSRYQLAGMFPEEEQEMMWENASHAAREVAQSDWTALRFRLVERQKMLSQIIRFNHGEKGVNLYNFTNTQLTEEQVGQMANAFREVSEMTGGGVFDILKVMAIVPNDDDEIIKKNRNGDIIATSSGGAIGSTIVFAEKVFNPDSLAPKVTNDMPVDLQDLGAEVTEETPFHVPGEPVQQFVIHELMHIVVNDGARHDQTLSNEYADIRGWEYPENGARNSLTSDVLPIRRGNPEAPTVYARMNHDEEIAVAAEAHIVGGKWENLYADQLVALSGILKARHSGVEGPMFVKATELPLPAPDNKLGRLPDVPIAIVPSYEYEVF